LKKYRMVNYNFPYQQASLPPLSALCHISRSSALLATNVSRSKCEKHWQMCVLAHL
jgi:hypothetical protein